MPYYITDKQPDCNGWATAKLENGQLITIGCHQDKQGAVDQMVAVSLAEGLEPMGEYTRNLNGEPILICDIDDTLIHAGELVERVYNFVDEQDADLYIVTGRPISEQTDTVAQLAALGIEYERLFMNDGSTANSLEFKKRTAEELLKTYNVTLAVENDADTRAAYASLGIETIDPADIPDQPAETPQSEQASQRDKWIRSAWAIKSRIEGGEVRSFGKKEIRTNVAKLEMRAGSDGMTFSGYAAVFNSDSQPLPFIERIAPGAFKRSLQARNEVKLLWNHDTNHPLASRRGGSLTLTEDSRGLFVEATLANTTTGRDVAELIRSGVIDSMSFGFSVIKDSWSQDGNVRTLEAVRLFEISAVTFPAYEGTAGTVSVRSIDPDKLADSLLALENGETLAADQAALIKEVADKLANDPDVIAVQGNLLDLKKKILDLKLKEI